MRVAPAGKKAPAGRSRARRLEATMTGEGMNALCQKWQDAFAKHDAEALAALYGFDANIDSPMAGGKVHGRDLIRQSFDAFFGALPDAKMTSEPPVIDGNRLALAAEISAKHVGHFMGLEPSEKNVRFRFVFLWDVE